MYRYWFIYNNNKSYIKLNCKLNGHHVFNVFISDKSSRLLIYCIHLLSSLQKKKNMTFRWLKVNSKFACCAAILNKSMIDVGTVKKGGTK